VRLDSYHYRGLAPRAMHRKLGACPKLAAIEQGLKALGAVSHFIF
jgi:hypothetical protein